MDVEILAIQGLGFRYALGEIVAIQDDKDHIRVRLHFYCTTSTVLGVPPKMC